MELPEKLGEIVPYDAAVHFEFISKWWELYYGKIDMPVDCVPPTGAVAMWKGKPVAAAFIYQTNAKMAMIHLPVVDPELGAGRRVFFLRSVIDGAIEMAKAWLDGKGFIWCCTDHSVVARVYRERGMTCPGESDIFFLPVGSQSSEFLK